MEQHLPLTKRISNVLSQQKAKKRKAQFESRESMEPKVDPTVKILDHLYETLGDEDIPSAFDVLYELTKHLGFEEDVAFEIPEEHEKRGIPQSEILKHSPKEESKEDEEEKEIPSAEDSEGHFAG